MQQRSNSYGNRGQGQAKPTQKGGGDFEKSYPAFRLKTKGDDGELVDIGGAFSAQSKKGDEYYKVSKTPYVIFKTDKDDLALKVRDEESDKLVTVAYLKPGQMKDGQTYYSGKPKNSEEVFFLYPFEKRA